MATLDQIRKEIRQDLKKLGGNNRILLQRMANQALADTTQRIFFEGKNSKDSAIGQYADSTAKQRRKRGRPTGKVNLDFTGQLKASYTTEIKDNKTVVLGFFDINRKSITGKSDKTTNSKLVDVLEDKYGDVFPLTSREDERLDAIIEDFIDELPF